MFCLLICEIIWCYTRYLCGHDHNLQHIKEANSFVDYFVVGAGHETDPSEAHKVVWAGWEESPMTISPKHRKTFPLGHSSSTMVSWIFFTTMEAMPLSVLTKKP